MAYSASAVAGTLLQLYSDSPGTYTTIRGVSGFQGPTANKPEIEVTAIDDTAAQYLAGIPDYGNITFEIFWDPANVVHQELKTDFDTVGSVSWFKIVPQDADGSYYGVVKGEINGFEHDFSRGQAQVVRITCRLSGALTWTT
jgi:hypothetical protein